METGRSTTDIQRGWLSALTVAFVLAVSLVLYSLNLQTFWDSSTLTLWLNVIVVAAPALLISLTASWSFLISGSWKVLLLGIGACLRKKFY